MFRFAHNNLNVLDLEKSMAFYEKALGLRETKRIAPPDGGFIIVYLGDGPEMGIYFISDPDGYWLEVIPAGRY